MSARCLLDVTRRWPDAARRPMRHLDVSVVEHNFSLTLSDFVQMLLDVN